MKILVNADPLAGVATGVARYVRSLYSAMVNHGGVETGYLHRGRTWSHMPPPRAAGARSLVPPLVRPLARHLRLSFRGHGYVRQLKRFRPDVYHETTMIAPPCSTQASVVMTVYDLSLLRYPQFHPRDRVRHFEKYFERRLACVDHVLTLSEFVRQEFMDAYRWPPERITAVPLAPDSVFTKAGVKTAASVCQQLGLPEEFLLFVGAREPRKNLNALLVALSKMKNTMPLVCASPSGWLNNDFDETVRRFGLEQRVLIRSSVRDDQLACLYSSATALVYPSLYEGFGLPILEAMSCACPVICSDMASLSEAAGVAALKIPAGDVDGLADALDTVVADAALRQELIRRGLAHAARFSWDKTAHGTLSVFERLGTH